MSRKQRKEHHEEHADETWLVPYSDILTLLLALFIVLFASSQIDQKKLEQMSASLNIAFSGSAVIFEKERAMENINQRPPSSNQQVMESLPNVPMPDFNVVPKAGGVDQATYMKETAELIELKKQMDKYISENGLELYLSTHLMDEGLMIRIKETALFPSGSAELRLESRRLAEQIAKMIVPITQEISISGHTDNVPINTFEFPSNWELSSKRAVNFMRLIIQQEKPLEQNQARFRAIGYGEYRPVAVNDTPSGRAQNRRVEVFIQRNYRP